MTIKIIADSTCDLSEKHIKENNIDILPLHILLNEDVYEDGINITPDDIYAWSDMHKSTPTTAAPNIAEAIDILNRNTDYDHIICFTISSEFSSCFNSVNIAARDLEITEKVHIIDSRNLSSGISLMILETASMIRQDKDIYDILRTINNMIPKINGSFITETLTYLYRGGRCNSVEALAGAALKIHPMIALHDGLMQVDRKYRGTMPKILDKYIDDLDVNLQNADKKIIFLIHSGCEKELIDQAYNRLVPYNFNDIQIIQTGGVISSHCGPGAIGLFFIEQ